MCSKGVVLYRPGPLEPPDLRLRIRGAILGTLIGDAFAAPFDGEPAGESLTRRVLERDGAIRAWPSSASGEATLAVAQSLVDRRGFEPDPAERALAGYDGPREALVAPLAVLFRDDLAGLDGAVQTLSPSLDAALHANTLAMLLAEKVLSLLPARYPAIVAIREGGIRHESLMATVQAGGAGTVARAAMCGALLGATAGPAIFPRLWAHNVDETLSDRAVQLSDELLEIGAR